MAQWSSWGRSTARATSTGPQAGMSDELSALICVDDFEHVAREKLPKMVFDYYFSGARDEISLKRNREALTRILLMPRILRNVTIVDTAVTVFGRKVPSPIMIAATAMHRMAHPEGEIATAKAAAESGTLMMLSSLSTTPLEHVAQACAGHSPLWFQLYVLKDRSATIDLVRRAEKSGYTAIAVTVDAPILGTREADVRNRFRLPEGLTLAHYAPSLDINLSVGKERGGSGLEYFIRDNLDASLTWDDIAWLKRQTKLPIVVKGVHSPADAALAVRYGVDGIIVSNHGARQLDTVPATIEMLPAVVAAVEGHIPVWVDGGFRRGTDVIKAIALGAAGVFLGRPIVWGLAAQGREGVAEVVRLLNVELTQALRLCGVINIAEIDKSLIWQKPAAL